MVDSYKYAASVVSKVVSDGYLSMVQSVPQMYRFLYSRAEQATEVGPFRAWAQQFTAGQLRPLMQQYAPSVVVCTHAFPCGAMAAYKQMFEDAPPVVGVVTDYAVHGFWAHRNVDAYAVATDELRAPLIERHVEEHRIHVTGIPVRRAFGVSVTNRDALRERLDLVRDRAVVLLMGGGLGIGPLEKMMRALSVLEEPLCVAAIVGRSRRCEARVLEYAQKVRYPVRVLPFVQNVDEYMHASDVLVSKPGGLTSTEALAAQLPMVLYKPLPGQEERNTEYLIERGAALQAKSIEELAAAVRTLLHSRQRYDAMRSAMRRLRKPRAAADVAALVCATARSGDVKSVA